VTVRALVACLLAGCGSSSLGVDRGAVDSGSAVDSAAIPAMDAAPPPDAAPQPDFAPPADVARIPDLLNGAFFTADWTIQWFGSPAKVTCAEAGTPTVVISTTDAANRTFEDRFPCEAMKGWSRQLPSGTYLFGISIEDERGQELGYARGEQELLPGRENNLGDKGFELQSFQLGWTLQRGGKPVTCAAAGATSVELVATLGSEAPVTYSFPCNDGKAATKGIRQGHYLVVMRLLGAGGTLLAVNPGVMVEAGDERRATVPPVTFALP
jgi:hypothetical protein